MTWLELVSYMALGWCVGDFLSWLLLRKQRREIEAAKVELVRAKLREAYLLGRTAYLRAEALPVDDTSADEDEVRA